MTLRPASPPARVIEATVNSRKDAEAFLNSIAAIMDELESLLSQESRLVRGALLEEALTLVERKSVLYVDYVRSLERLRSEKSRVSQYAPDLVAALRERHAALQETLAVNLAVLGTAKAVSEDVMRSVAEDVAAQDRPSTYGASGKTSGYGQRPPATPLSVSRKL